MKTTVNFYSFERAFFDAGRSEQFSYEGLQILFDYLEEYEQATGEELELDVIALCCDYSELTESEIIEYYDIPSEMDVESYLDEKTIICGSFENDNEETVFVFQQW